MSDKQQSAVDFLVSHFEQAGIDYGFFKPTIEQAKELFKQQIIDAYDRKNVDSANLVRISFIKKTSVGEQYFNETFKTESNGK